MNRNGKGLRQQIATEKRTSNDSRTRRTVKRAQNIRHFPGRPGAQVEESSSEGEEDEEEDEEQEAQEQEREEHENEHGHEHEVKERTKVEFKPLTRPALSEAVEVDAPPVQSAQLDEESSEGEYVTEDEEEEEQTSTTQHIQPPLPPIPKPAGGEAESEDSEGREESSEESSEESEDDAPVLVKPVFVPK